MHDYPNKPSGSLFDELPAFLPVLTPGETLFSWSARYHRLSGNVHASESSLQLFGDRRAGLRHDFPSHLDSFSQITGGRLGETTLLAREHTLIGFFSKFLDEERFSTALNMMRSSSVARLKNSLGILPSRMGAAHPLKACRKCMATDLREFGITRWHIEHQWPSVWVCCRHAAVLQMLRNQRELKSLRRYILPEDVENSEWLAFDIKGAKRVLLGRLAEFSSALVSGSIPRFDVGVIRYAAIEAAAACHWVASDGSLRFREAREAFADYYRGLESLPGFANLLSVEKDSGGLLGLMLRKYEGARHPVKQILMLAFFFASPGEFFDAYRRASMKLANGDCSEFGRPRNQAWRSDLRRIVGDERKSLSQAARELAIPLAQVFRYANQDGLEYNRRPRILSVDLERRIRALAIQGLGKEEIAGELRVKASFLRAYLAANIDVKEILRSSQRTREVKRRRAEFLMLQNEHRGLPVSRIKRIPGNGYTWLLKNDRQWLLANMRGVL